jgi:hypothetical protein
MSVSTFQQRATTKKGLLALALVSCQAMAFQPLITDDAGTQGAGGNQIEVSFTGERTKFESSVENQDSLPVVYTRGLTETLDVFVSAVPARVHRDGDTASGMGNTSVGAKWRFFEEGDTSLALKPEVFFPVSAGRENAGLGTGKASGALTFIASQDLSFGSVHFNASVGRQRFRDTTASPDATAYKFSLAPVWDVCEQWKLALDLGVESAHAAGQTVNTKFAEIGAIYSPGKDIDLAFGVIRKNDNESPRSTTDSVTVATTFRF